MNEEKPKIDILMATYNGENFIVEQIESILNQSYKNINLIISDDCSKDSTANILKRYENRDNIKIFYQKNNLGYVKNFEFLLNQVTSDIFALSDQDDFWLPEKVEKSYKRLIEDNADLVFGDLKVVDKTLKNVIFPSFNDYMKLSRKIKKYINSRKMNYLYDCVTGCTLMARSKWLDMILPIPCESKYMIHDYWIAMMININGGKLSYIPEKYILYRQHGNNQIGATKNSNKFKKLDDVRNLFLDVKLGIFQTYVDNNSRFPKDVQEENIKSLNYYKMLKKKKNANFKCWNVFHNLYKMDSFMYYIESFIIFNLPILGRGIFKIRYAILKLMKER